MAFKLSIHFLQLHSVPKQSPLNGSSSKNQFSVRTVKDTSVICMASPSASPAAKVALVERLAVFPPIEDNTHQGPS